MKKKLLWILPVILVIAVAVSVFAFGKAGFCGKGVMWFLNGNTLTVTGKGQTDSFAEGELPWNDHIGKVTQIKVKNGITSLGENLFSSHPSLKSVSLPQSVEAIEFSAFLNCQSLESIFVHPDNPNYSSDEHGVLFDRDKTVLICYPSGKKDTSYTVPDSVTTIGLAAFAGASGLERITFSDNLKYIENQAFAYCERLRKIVLPDTVTSIGTQGFYCCSSLKSIVIPGSVRAISMAAFSLCPSLDSIYFVGTAEQWAPLLVEVNNNWQTPPTVSFILNHGICGDNAEYFVTRERTLVISGYGDTFDFTQDSIPWISLCDKILSVSVSDGITGLGNGIFSGLLRVGSVNIPQSVTYIGTGAFDGFTKDQTINIEKSPDQSFADDWQTGCEATINYIAS